MPRPHPIPIVYCPPVVLVELLDDSSRAGGPWLRVVLLVAAVFWKCNKARLQDALKRPLQSTDIHVRFALDSCDSSRKDYGVDVECNLAQRSARSQRTRGCHALHTERMLSTLFEGLNTRGSCHSTGCRTHTTTQVVRAPKLDRRRRRGRGRRTGRACEARVDARICL